MACRVLRPSILSLFVVVTWARQGFAQTEEDLERARQQFREAMALQAAGDCAGALPRLEAVARVKTTPHVRFNIALCEERLGKLVSAAGNYRLALEEAEAASIQEVADPARSALDALSQRIPTITIVRGAGAEDASILLDGVALGDAAIGQALRRDPGHHTIVATAGNRRAFERTLKLAEADHQRVEVIIERRDDTPNAAVSPARDVAVEEGTDPTPVYVAGGIGAAGLVAAGVFFFLRQDAIGDLEKQCDGLECPPDAESAIDRGKLYTGLAEGAAALAVVGLGTAAVLYFTGESAERRPSSPRLSVSAGATKAGPTVRLRGTF